MAGWNFKNTYTQLPPIFWRKQTPAKAPAPRMVIFNDNLAADLGLDADGLRNKADIFSGNILPHGADPIAQAYAGYQFGHFAMLGDGRALILGEHVTPRGQTFDIQLKGSGPTEFSRGGDGFGALGPMLREYIISHAMAALGIPTTRSLAVAQTGADIMRMERLKGAVLTRVAASHIRVGTFNFAAAYGSVADMRALADYAIARHFPNIEQDAPDKYLHFFRATAALQARLIAEWMLVGFVHGVMNTDNMSICGETIDYGPCAFLDVYDEAAVFSSIDTHGRYNYKNQRPIGAWNLARLAESLMPLFAEDQNKAADLADDEIRGYLTAFDAHYHDGMCAKLGLHSADNQIITDLLAAMQTHRLDYTATLRALANNADIAPLAQWQTNWRRILAAHPKGADFAHEQMRRKNPAVIPRNHRVEEALAAAENDDFAPLHNLLAALAAPYEDNAAYGECPAENAPYRTFCGT